ncbi:protein NLRC5 isoform X2 [Pelobates fuscus]|uniref:protein NLRC5 isoform X2 n=1 Tax=Pelobates fuscus TaxID=191477 RepID=UPI002FE4443E
MQKKRALELDNMEDLDLQEESLFSQLLDHFVHHVDWMVTEARLFLPNVDISHIKQKSDNLAKVSAVLQEFRESHSETWKKFIQHICMDGNLPMELETQLLSLTGEGAEEISWERFLAGEFKGSARRKLVSTNRYKKQIVNTILKKYGFRDNKKPDQMFVDPLIHTIKMTKVKQRSKSGNKILSATEDIMDSVKMAQMFHRTNLSKTHTILLVGMPGTGKTLLTHRIAHEWAGGGFGQFQLTFLFEFRQLNLIKTQFTLKELLFNLFLKPDTDLEEVYEYIIENPQKVLIIFDGLDEFVGKMSQDFLQISQDLKQVVPISEMFQNLLHGKVLSGCTVVVTSRSKILLMINDLLDLVDCVAEVLGFNEQRVQEYVRSFFPEGSLQQQALLYLRDNHKLMHMCFVPALCHIVCKCLKHMLPMPPENTQLPQTITQFYLKMLNIFIRKKQMSYATEGVVLKRLISELCNLAFNGLKENKTVFYDEDISDALKKFAPHHRLLSTFDVKKMDSSTDPGYSFVHLSSQEFFASLYLMMSKTITHNKLNTKLSLKSKWNMKFKTKEEFTDNFHIFLSGLSSTECRSFLVELSENQKVLVEKKQETIIKYLHKMADTNLSGPKLIELCHCVYETQDTHLARSIGSHLERYEFKNIRINPVDMTALSFVVSYGDNLASLDFGGCSMELDCLVVLEKCENIRSLSFRNKKYGDAFAQALSKCLRNMNCLKNFRLTAGRIRHTGIDALCEAFLYCQQLQEINLQDNSLKSKDMLAFLDLFPKMDTLKHMDLSNNEINANSTLTLTKAASKCPRITDVKISVEPKTAIFKSDLAIPVSSPQVKRRRRDGPAQGIKKTLSLASCELTLEHIRQLVEILTECPHLCDVNLSDNPLGDPGCKVLFDALPKINIYGKLSLDKTELSAEGILYLVGSMISCPNVKQVEIRFLQQTAAIHFLTDREDGHKSIRINECRMSLKLLEKLCIVLQKCKGLSDIDLSDNSFENASICHLTRILHELPDLRSMNFNGNKINICKIINLTECLSSVDNMTDLAISYLEHQNVLVKFKRKTREKTPKSDEDTCGVLKTFSLQMCRITSHKLQKIFRALERCNELTKMNLSDNALSCQNIENMLKFLPRFPNLTFVNFNNSDLSTNCVLLLANSASFCDRIKEVDIRSAEHMCLHLEMQQRAKEVLIRLNNCNLGKNDVDQLVKVFQQIPNLIEVSMCMNKLYEDGILSLLSALCSCSNVTAVHACLHPKETIRILFSPNVDSLKEIRLAECNFQPEHFKRLLFVLNDCTNLTHFISKRNRSFLDVYSDCLAVLSRSPNGVTISIHEPSVRLEHIIDLIHANSHIVPSVKAIRVRKNKVILELKGRMDCTQRIVSQLQDLRSLRLNHCELQMNLNFLNAMLNNCTRLSELNLSNNSLGDAGIRDLAKVLPSLVALRTLDFSRNAIGDAGALSMAKLLENKQDFHLINLSHCFSVASEGGRRFIAGLLHCTELREIHLECLQLDDVSLQILCPGFSNMPSLKTIMLSENSIKYNGLRHLAQHLCTCTLIEAIDLSSNSIGNAGVETLSGVLAKFKNLKKIILSQNKIGPSGAMKLEEAIRQCKQLEMLHLQSCSLPENHGYAVVQALVLCQEIEDISLAVNTLGERSLLKLAEELHHFHRLRKIDLRLCGISDTVCTSLASGFRCCLHLEEVNLSWNTIGDEGACALACALKHMKMLKKMDLGKNQIQERGAEALAEELSVCSWIKLICLWSNQVPTSTAEKLKEPRLNFA